MQLLQAENIFRVVNCQELTSCNFFEGDARFEYRRFPVSRWRTEVNTDEDVIRYFEEGCHAWIAANLDEGRNVLVHCLAGAHRAGTTGVSFMMREGRYNADTAIRLAKALRPVIDPFGSLLELLERLERAYAASGRAALSPRAGSMSWLRLCDPPCCLLRAFECACRGRRLPTGAPSAPSVPLARPATRLVRILPFTESVRQTDGIVGFPLRRLHHGASARKTPPAF